jgi:hypothetical protein
MIQLSQRIGDTKTFSIPLKWNGRPFLPENEWSLIFTAKSQPNTQLDSAASIKKQSNAGIIADSNFAKVNILPADTSGSTTVTALSPGLLYWDIQAQKILDALDIRTVAGGTLNLLRDVTRGEATYVPPSPGTFAASLNVSYAQQSIPFYATTATVNYSYVVTRGTATQYAGTITPATSTTLNATAASGTLTNVPNRTLTLSGSITGTGTNGAGSTTVPITGTVSAVPVYFPAFYKNTSSSSIPTWATSDVQTASTPTGQITFPSPTAGTDYSWLATKIAATSITISTFLGPRLIEPNITTTVVISNETFNLYGFTRLAPGYPIQLNFI